VREAAAECEAVEAEPDEGTVDEQFDKDLEEAA
jgi:hypothetical protein